MGDYLRSIAKLVNLILMEQELLTKR